MPVDDAEVHPPMIFAASETPATSQTVPTATSSENPIQHQRRRVWRACESCRRKKIKCDGHEPTCGQCLAARLQCQWTNSRDRAAPSRHYVQELETRLLQMEGLLNQMTAEKGKPAEGSSALSHASTPSAVQPGISPQTSSTISSPSTSPTIKPDKIKREDTDPAMTEKFGQLALDEHGHGRWLGTSSSISLLSSVRALTSAGLERASPSSPCDDGLMPPSMASLYFSGAVMFGKTNALPSIEEVIFPPPEITDALVNAYFARYHFLAPILDKPKFLEVYSAIRDNAESRTDPALLSVLFAVFACASRLVDDPGLTESGLQNDDERGMVYYERALILHYIGHPQIQIAQVQCFTLLASYLCSANCLPQAWLLVGQALRTAQDLGLHRSPLHLPISAIEKETRRKIWWNVYCLDRMLAVALGRPMGIDDVDCDVELPVDLDDEELPIYFSGAQINRAAPSLMTGFVALTGLYTIAGRLLRQVYALRFCKENIEPTVMAELQASVDDLDRQLDDWCEQLPACFKSQPVNEQQISMGAVLCSSWYAVRITLHRNFLPVARNSQPPPGSTSATKAVSAARSCIFLASSIKSVIPPSHHLAFFVQYLFSSAVIILLCAIHATDDGAASQAMREANNCLNALAELEGIWPGARKCKELLSELSAATRETMRNEAAKKNSPPTAPLHPPLVYPNPPAARQGPSHGIPTSPLSPEGSRPSHRTVKSKRTAHSKRRSLSQRRQRDDSEGPRDYPSLSSTPPDRDRPIRSMRRSSMSNRSPSASRRVGLSSGAVVNNSPVFVENTSPDQTHGMMPISNQALFEVPPSTAQGNGEGTYMQDPSGRWAYEQNQDWNVPSPIDNPRGMVSARGTEFQYASASSYGMFDSRGDAIDPSTLGYTGLVEHNGTSLVTPFESEGLPFAGLEFLHSYDPNSNDPGSLELWNSLGPSAFEYGPEVPFAVGDQQPSFDEYK